MPESKNFFSSVFGLTSLAKNGLFIHVAFPFKSRVECHEKVLFSCQRHFRKKGKTMIMFLSEKHFDIPFRGSLI